MEEWRKAQIDWAWEIMEAHVKEGDFGAAYVCLRALREREARKFNWDLFNNDVTKAKYIGRKLICSNV